MFSTKHMKMRRDIHELFVSPEYLENVVMRFLHVIIDIKC